MLNNEDKKYLKENIERRLDKIEDRLDGSNKNVSEQSLKVLSEQEKAQKFREEISKKFNSLYKDQKTPDEKKDYKHNLQKLDDMGIATLAEKVELLKLQIKDSVPKEFTDAVKQSGKLAKQGANQALKGASNIVGKAMNLNPLTAMIWAQRGLVGDVANIGIGGVKAVAGGVGALAGGVGKLTSAALAMLPKPKIKQTNDEETPTDETTNEETGLFASNAKKVEEIEETEDGGAKQLSDLHKLFVKGDYLKKRDERDKESQNIMSKGLGVMAKGINGINTVVGGIMAKQKLILGALLVGALGILALVGWYKNGGMDSMMDKFKQSLASGRAPDAHDDALQVLQDKIKNLREASDSANQLNKNVEDIKVNTPQGSALHRAANVSKQQSEINKRLNISGDLNLMNAFGSSGTGYLGGQYLRGTLEGAVSKKTGITEVKFPFEVYLINKIQSTINPKHATIILARGKGKNTVNIGFTKALKVYFEPNGYNVIKPNTKIAELDEGFAILGSRDLFYGFKEGEHQYSETDIKNELKKNSKKLAEDAQKAFDKHYQTPGIGNDLGAVLADQMAGVKTKITEEDVKNYIEGKEIPLYEPKKESKTTVEETAPTYSSNSVKPKPNTNYKEMSPNATVRPLPTLNVYDENLSTKINKEAKQVKATGTHTIAPETSEGNTTKQQKPQINLKAFNKSGSKGIPGEYLSTSQYYAATAAK